jgi:hypothetical protein
MATLPALIAVVVLAIALVPLTRRPDLASATPTGSCNPEARTIWFRAGTAPKRVDGSELRGCLRRTGFRSFEPTIGVDKAGSVYVYPAIGQDPVNEAVPDAPAWRRGPIQMAASSDRGRTWQRIGPKVGPFASHPSTGDPYMYLDRETGRLFALDLTPFAECSYISYSDDRGRSWFNQPLVCGGVEDDFPSVFAGPPPPGVRTFGYPNVVYYCYHIYAVVRGPSCSRSLDGGRTWIPGHPAVSFDPSFLPYHPFDAICAVYGSITHGGVVAKDGTVYLGGHCSQPMISISEDAGLTWRTIELPTSETDQGTIALDLDSRGNLYVMWIDEDDRLPYLITSRDGGRSWSKPIKVAFPGLKESNLPAVDVTGPGHVAIAFLGSTNSPGPPFPESRYDHVTWNGYIVISRDALSARPLFAAAPVNRPDQPLDTEECGPAFCYGQFDFISVQTGPDGTPWAAFVEGGGLRPYEIGLARALGLRAIVLGEGVVGYLSGRVLPS